MPERLVPVKITRSGAAIHGSPFLARPYRVTSFSGRSAEIAPHASKVQTARALTFRDIRAPVAVGDLATLPDGTLGRVVDVRRYERALQADLQILPFGPLKLWTPTSPAGRIVPGTLNVSDLSFEAAPDPLLGYLEPAPEMVKLSVFGRIDARACYLFSLDAVPMRAVVIDASGQGWVAEMPSDVWPVTGDVRTLVKHLDKLPKGVS